MSDFSECSGVGLVVITRLHRLGRHGFRPWLGYSASSQEDQDIHLRRRKRAGRMMHEEVATILPDGSVWFVFKVPLSYPRRGADGEMYDKSSAICADDAENFDALFPKVCPPPSRGWFTRWLYAHGY